MPRSRSRLATRSPAIPGTIAPSFTPARTSDSGIRTLTSLFRGSMPVHSAASPGRRVTNTRSHFGSGLVDAAPGGGGAAALAVFGAGADAATASEFFTAASNCSASSTVTFPCDNRSRMRRVSLFILVSFFGQTRQHVAGGHLAALELIEQIAGEGRRWFRLRFADFHERE